MLMMMMMMTKTRMFSIAIGQNVYIRVAALIVVAFL